MDRPTKVARPRNARTSEACPRTTRHPAPTTVGHQVLRAGVSVDWPALDAAGG
jgi:hypothetical protein